MKRMALGMALVLGSAATASAAVVYYPDGYITYSEPQVVRVERVTAPEVVAYNDRYVTYTTSPSYSYPRAVDTYVMPASRETIVVQADPVSVPRGPIYNEWNPRHPEWGHLIDYGLFNRTGPTDWGR